MQVGNCLERSSAKAKSERPFPISAQAACFTERHTLDSRQSRLHHISMHIR